METLSQPQRDAEADEAEYSATLDDWKTLLRCRAWKDLQYFVEEAVEVGKELLALEMDERQVKESDDSLRGGIKISRRILEFPHLRMKELSDDS